MNFFKLLRKKMEISHLTDIEGNFRYFAQWASRSSLIKLKKNTMSFCKTKTDTHFVYGGDFCDKGPGDLRIGHALVDFKEKHPQEVTLIAGNRDIKSRRFTYELKSNIRQRLLEGAPAYWSPNSTPFSYLMEYMKSEGKVWIHTP